MQSLLKDRWIMITGASSGFGAAAARAKKVYECTHPAVAEHIAEILVWIASRPPHVNIDELIVKRVNQASMQKIHRRSA